MRATTIILGARGMLGACWASAMAESGEAAAMLDRSRCDLTDTDSIECALTPGVRRVINCAAYTDVDGAEADEPQAASINGVGAGELARRCLEIDALLVHFSTDYVFDGASAAPYPVDHPRRPINAYGRTKALGEKLIEDSGAEHLIIRTSWLYAPHGRNFVRTIASACRQRPSLRVVNDQRGRPTSAHQLVTTTQRLLESGARGVYHACDDGDCTWFELAQAIAQRLSPSCVIEPCSTDEFPRPATRPASSVLDLSKTTGLIGPIPHWRLSLERALTQLKEQEAEAVEET